MLPAETAKLLKNRPFLHLWLNHFLQQISYNMVNFSLIIWVFELTGINTAVSLWGLAFLIPSISLSVVAGVLADNYDRKRIIINSNLLWALTILCFTFTKNSFPLILLVTFVAQGIDEFFFPSQNATLARLVDEDELLAANSLFSLTIPIAAVVGFFLAGPLLRFFGYSAPFLLAAFFVSLGAFSVSFLPSVRAVRRKIDSTTSVYLHFKKEIRSELLLLARRRKIFTTGLSMALLYGGIGAVGAIGPGFMEQGLRIDAKDLSFIGIIPVIAGVILGTSLVSRFGNRWKEEKMIKGGLLVLGLTLLFLASTPSLRAHFAGGLEHTFNSLVDYSSYRFGMVGVSTIPFERLPGFSLLIGFAAFILGAALTFVLVPLMATLQRITPDRARGRTFGAFNMLTSILAALFIISAGIMADLLSPSLLVALAGLTTFCFAFLRERLFGLVFTIVKAIIK